MALVKSWAVILPVAAVVGFTLGWETAGGVVAGAAAMTCWLLATRPHSSDSTPDHW